jgi:cysteinyl-tRNA synthetase
MGFPGWHIECSVLSTKYLGQPFDIHGSANEHIFPHHENEIAQSEAFADKPLARFFLHSGMLLINGQKMAKSAENYLTIKDALKKYDRDTIKIAFMGTHWRKPFNWEENTIKEARILQDRLIRAKESAQPIKTGFPTEINQALENDFNVPKALAIIIKNLSKLSRNDYEYLQNIFGLDLKAVVRITSKQKKMIQDREKARKEGDYRGSDRIRDKLKKEGIFLEDTAIGTRIFTPSKSRG